MLTVEEFLMSIYAKARGVDEGEAGGEERAGATGGGG